MWKIIINQSDQIQIIENWYLDKSDYLKQLSLMNFHKFRRQIWVNNEKTLIDQFSKDEKWS